MSCKRILSIAAVGILAFGLTAQALEPIGTAQLRMIPQDQIGEIQYLTVNNGQRSGCLNWAVVYDNRADVYMSLRVPDSAAGPGTMWLADDMMMSLPNGATEWLECGYLYLTYAYGGTGPYTVDSGLYSFVDCVADVHSLVDWTTGDCCVDPVEIPGTHGTAAITVNGMVEVTIVLDTPVMVPEYYFMLLDYSGANVADNAGWVIAYEAEIGFTDDFWVEDILGVGCGLFWFGGDPYAGFRAKQWGDAAAKFSLIPSAADPSGGEVIVGDTITLDCHDLPQCVQIEAYAHDWDTDDLGVMIKGFQNMIGCTTYYSNASATLVASATDCSPGPCAVCTLGGDKSQPSYIFPLGDFAACSTASMCPDAVNGMYSCLSGALASYADDHTWKYMNHYAFTVPAGAKGMFTVSLDERTLYTQLSDPTATPILPLGLNDAYILIETGMCCYNIAAGTADCTDGVTECECDLLPTPSFWEAGAYCPPPPETCCQCLTDNDCYDGDACTVDTCDPLCICNNTPVAVAADECCDSVPVNLAADVGGLGNIANIDDGDVCTDDFCNPGGGCAVAPYCGVPQHDPGPGNPCCELHPENADKPQPCTFDDACNYYCVGVEGVIHPLVLCGGEPPGFCEGIEPMAMCEWGCYGEDVNLIPCVDDADCLVNAGTGYPCPPDPVQYECKYDPVRMGDYCYCAPLTRLWLDVLDEDCCFEPGDPIVVKVRKTAGADTITGAQFVVYYDPDCVEFDSVNLGDYPLLLYKDIDEVTGMIFMAVGIQPFTTPGFSGPALFATLNFHCKAACIHCQICYGQAVNPPNTVLTNDKGEHVTMVSWGCSNNGDACEVDADCDEGAYCGCTCLIVQLGDQGIVVPDDVAVNSDCMAYTAIVTWDTPPYYWNECAGHGGVDLAGPDGVWGTVDDLCFGVHDPYVPEDQMSDAYIMTLIEGGGEFAQGVTTFCCEGPPCHLCDVPPVTDCWTVEVSDQNAMDVIVQYSPEMAMGPYIRGIVFELFIDCFHDPIVVCEDLVFGPPFDFVGKATEVLKVPKGQIMCITAADPLHTIRSVDMPIECVGNALVAEFHGDPLLGGNWLINGNLNGDHHIDIIDFGIFLSQYMMPMSADTPCGTVGPNADINGDGVVDAADFAHIAMNFIAESKDACCDDPTSGWQGEPTLSISVKDLRLMGMGELAVADLNDDGMVDESDIVAFMQGSAPVAPVREVKRGVERSLR